MQYEVDIDLKFYGVIKSVKHIVTLIKSINIRNVVNVFIHEDGMTLTVEQPRSVRVTAYLRSYLFHIYNIQEDYYISSFGLPVDALINCLRAMLPSSSISTINTSDFSLDYCEVKYDGIGSMLSLRRIIKEHNQTINCDLIPFEPEDESEDLVFSDTSDGVPQKMRLQGGWFKGVINDLGSSTEKIELTFSQQSPSFRLVGEGSDSTYESDYPENSEPFISFTCDRELTNTYLYSDIILCKKALDNSSEVIIEMFNNGKLKMFFRIDGPHHTEDLVEFSFLPSTSFT